MKAPANVWVERLVGLDDLAVIRDRVRVAARRLEGLMEAPRGVAVASLTAELKRVFYPTDQVCQLLREHVQRAQVFAGMRYPTAMSFLNLAEANEPSLAAASCWCLTGPAGIGKSALMQALERLIPPRQNVFVSEQFPAQPLGCLSRIVVDEKSTDSELLRALGNPAVLVQKQRLNQVDLVKHVRQWFLATGVSTFIGDELQFVTQSANANTRVAKLLLVLTYLSVPMTYVANYSLVHRLKRRPQEERQRLLANLKLLLPDDPHSDCWRAVIQVFLDAAPDAFNLAIAEHAVDLHRYSGGIKRVLRQLLVLAFEIAHARVGDRRVNIQDVRAAYRSAAFDVNRGDIEAMISISSSPQLMKARSDLACPVSAVAEGRSAHATADRARSERTAKELMWGALSKDELAAAKNLQQAAARANNAGVKPTVVSLRKPKPSLSVEELLRGSAAAERKIRAPAESSVTSGSSPEKS